MVDETVCNATTCTKSISRCFVCGATAKKLNQSDLKKKDFKNLKLKPQNCGLIVCIGDRYNFEESLKQTERYRGSTNCHFETYEIRDELDIPDWKKFITNLWNKKNLLAYLAQKLMKEHYVIPDQIEIVLAGMSEDNQTTIKCTKMESTVVDELQFTGHKKADTRIFAINNFFKDTFNVFVIYSLDTDVFVLSMCFSVTLDVEIWIERENKFIPCFSIIKEVTNLKHLDVKVLVDNLLSIYCLSGCDSVSFPFKKGKKSPKNSIVSRTK
ncbi:unnamed protein product [Psylliodes chrysocephalus]|uniref:Uncharacterized protein n=1 Tax=Psylliodes chrysocephalus TaxID=3402493 RepID=A0A9P0CJF6_9CUCU|nr:unnamed protein product [Psylliodes chrysocephala]